MQWNFAPELFFNLIAFHFMKAGFGQMEEALGANCSFSFKKAIITGGTHLGIKQVDEVRNPGNHKKVLKR